MDQIYILGLQCAWKQMATSCRENGKQGNFQLSCSIGCDSPLFASPSSSSSSSVSRSLFSVGDFCSLSERLSLLQDNSLLEQLWLEELDEIDGITCECEIENNICELDDEGGNDKTFEGCPLLEFKLGELLMVGQSLTSPKNGHWVGLKQSVDGFARLFPESRAGNTFRLGDSG